MRILLAGVALVNLCVADTLIDRYWASDAACREAYSQKACLERDALAVQLGQLGYLRVGVPEVFATQEQLAALDEAMRSPVPRFWLAQNHVPKELAAARLNELARDNKRSGADVTELCAIIQSLDAGIFAPWC